MAYRFYFSESPQQRPYQIVAYMPPTPCSNNRIPFRLFPLSRELNDADEQDE